MGLLNSNSLNEWATAIPDRAKALYAGLLNAPAELKQMFTPEFAERGRRHLEQIPNSTFGPPSGLLSFTPEMREKAMQLAMDVMPGGIAGKIVYHGSPHKFNKFDMSKIGTGEGAQAYGHGLYMAESPEVAKSYMNAGGYLSNSPHKLAADTVSSMGGIDKALKHLEHILPPKGETTFSGQSRELIEDAIASIKSGGYQSSGANLYKVDIPDEAIPKMLDWDKPLSEQPQNVQEAINRVGRMPEPYGLDRVADDMRMVEMQKLFQSREGVEALRKQGIPGIRYLDGMSRGAGEGSSNYVLFDDALARILEINGQPTGLLPWADDVAKKVKK